jgi:hypothetical protein
MYLPTCGTQKKEGEGEKEKDSAFMGDIALQFIDDEVLVVRRKMVE